MARPALAEDPQEQRAGFVELVRKLQESRHELVETATVSVAGYVVQPGPIVLKEGMTADEAIAAAGGRNQHATKYFFRLFRNAKEYNLRSDKAAHRDLLLRPGDTIMVKMRDEEEVNSPASGFAPTENLFGQRNSLPEEEKVSPSATEPIEQLRYVKDDSTMWYVQFGLESGGKWAPKFEGRTSDGRRVQNRVLATEMLSPGDTFFRDGEMAGRFKFAGIVEEDVMNERTAMTQKVKFGMYEDLKANKQGEKYEAQYGLPDAELSSHAYYDRTAVLRFPGEGGGMTEFKVEEGTKFALPTNPSDKSYVLKKVSPESVAVEHVNSSGTPETVTIPKDVGR
jgi:hypothetical protein